MEIESAARRVLLLDQTVAGLVARWVFKWRLEEKVDGTGKQAIVLWRDQGWSTPDPVNTNEYPLLTVDCYSDASRGADGEMLAEDNVDRAFGLYRVVDRALLSVGRGKKWGAFGSDPGLLVNSVQRWSEPFKTEQSDQHQGDPPLGDVAKVTTTYAFDLVH